MSGVDQRAVVVQLGARRRYAVPEALLAADRLECLYTDICLSEREAGWTAYFSKYFSAWKMDLSKRRVSDQLLARTRRFPSWAWDVRRAGRLMPDDLARFRATAAAHDAAGRKMLRSGFGNATHVVTMFGEGGPFLDAARARGITVVTDMNIAPSAEAIVAREYRRYPAWGNAISFFGESFRGIEGIVPVTDRVLETTDIFLCPSEFVRHDLVQNYGVSAARTRLVPYSVHPSWFSVENKPVPGRVLFVGSPDLRKGIHVVAEVAQRVRDRYPRSEFLIAGAVSREISAMREVSRLHFLGKLTSAQIREEFSKADVFLFPSIAEGSAGVTYEALACGVPVVTTFAAGSIVRNAIDGFVCKEPDTVAIADRVEHLISDRSLRASMASSARERAAAHDWTHFSRTINDAIFGRDMHRSSLIVG